MFCKRCGVGKISKHYGVGHGSVPCWPLFVLPLPLPLGLGCAVKAAEEEDEIMTYLNNELIMTTMFVEQPLAFPGYAKNIK